MYFTDSSLRNLNLSTHVLEIFLITIDLGKFHFKSQSPLLYKRNSDDVTNQKKRKKNSANTYIKSTKLQSIVVICRQFHEISVAIILTNFENRSSSSFVTVFPRTDYHEQNQRKRYNEGLLWVVVSATLGILFTFHDLCVTPKKHS